MTFQNFPDYVVYEQMSLIHLTDCDYCNCCMNISDTEETAIIT